MPRDVAFGPAPIGSFDRIDPELEIAAAVEDARTDDPLDELVVGRPDARDIVGRGRRIRRRARG